MKLLVAETRRPREACDKLVSHMQQKFAGTIFYMTPRCKPHLLQQHTLEKEKEDCWPVSLFESVVALVQ